MNNDRIKKELEKMPRKTREEFLLILRGLSKCEGSAKPGHGSQE